MKKLMMAVAALVLTATSIHAQRPLPGAAMPRTWVSGYGLMYTNISALRDPDSESRWAFDDSAWGFGAQLHRQVGSGLLLGVDASFARPAYERQELDGSAVIESGTATIATTMATGRFSYGGASEVGLYLTGGVGSVLYHLEDLASWNADLALQAGTGLEYRFHPRRALALEWGRTWGYHEKEGLGGGTQQHSVLKLAFRLGF
jgi:opacity protein-like surface antigen